MHILCGVCLSVLNNVDCPASYLPCGHVFCTSCCEELVDHATCPFNCRTATLLRQDIRLLKLTTVPIYGAAQYAAAVDDLIAVSQASICSRVQQEVLEARGAYYIQAIKVAEIVKDYLLAEGKRIMARQTALKKVMIATNTLSTRSYFLLVGERLSAKKLAKEFSDLRSMIQCQRESLEHVLLQGKSLGTGCSVTHAQGL